MVFLTEIRFDSQRAQRAPRLLCSLSPDRLNLKQSKRGIAEHAKFRLNMDSKRIAKYAHLHKMGGEKNSTLQSRRPGTHGISKQAVSCEVGRRLHLWVHEGTTELAHRSNYRSGDRRTQRSWSRPARIRLSNVLSVRAISERLEHRVSKAASVDVPRDSHGLRAPDGPRR